jgi:serine/threonine protein kinase
VRGQPFFSLEFCDGGTLTDQLNKQRQSPGEAAELIEMLARARRYAHLRRVVHRDLKLGNVLLAGVERLPRITDFGLVKRIDAEACGISQSGAIMGTASYMAPEQAASKVRDTGPAAFRCDGTVAIINSLRTIIPHAIPSAPIGKARSSVPRRRTSPNWQYKRRRPSSSVLEARFHHSLRALTMTPKAFFDSSHALRCQGLVRWPRTWSSSRLTRSARKWLISAEAALPASSCRIR